MPVNIVSKVGTRRIRPRTTQLSREEKNRGTTLSTNGNMTADRVRIKRTANGARTQMSTHSLTSGGKEVDLVDP